MVSLKVIPSLRRHSVSASRSCVPPNISGMENLIEHLVIFVVMKVLVS